MSASFVAYRGPSQLDSEPIMAIAVPASSNRKTGPMVQIHIVRDDMHPMEALVAGADVSICGDCPLRGDLGRQRACYVVVGKGPTSAWKAATAKPTLSHVEVLDRLRGTALRLGAYGDPAALPIERIESWCRVAASHTGYTHQWRSLSADWRRLVMASVETEEQAREAWAWGWRTYRIADAPIRGLEITCPHVTRGVQCHDCGLCDGNGRRARSITIPAHGSGRRLVHA